MHSLITRIFVLVLFLLPPAAFGQTILLANTTWQAGSVVNLSGNVEIAPDVTLTIEPGVVVNGKGQSIIAYGTLTAIGTSTQRIQFVDTQFSFGDDYKKPGHIEIRYTLITGGSVIPATGNAGYGSFDLTDSLLTGVGYSYIWYPTADCHIERNVFVKSGGLSIGTHEKISAYVTNNVFVNMTGVAVENWANYDDTANTIVTGNSFLDTGKQMLRLPSGYTSANMVAINNYFGTTDVTVINAMIFDRNDTLTSASYVSYLPYLTAPAAATPSYTLVSPGVVTAPSRPQIVSITAGHGKATLNLSASNTDGGSAIVAYAATCAASGQPTKLTSGTGLTLTVLGLKGGELYSCTAIARNTFYPSASSVPTQVIPEASRLDMTPTLMLLLD
jgi:hypothetical protein